LTWLLALALAAALLDEAVRPPVVIVRSPTRLSLAPGTTADVRVTVAVAEGFHVQANPASEPYLIPIRLELGDDPRVHVGLPAYPAGKPYRLKGSSIDFSTYEGTFELCIPLSAPRMAAPGDATLEGVLRYQACNDRICLKPAAIPVRISVRIASVPRSSPR